MADNGQNIVTKSEPDAATLREILRMQKIAVAAVHKAQAENRRLGIPNWYSINGKIVSDLQSEDQQTAA